MSAQNRMIPTDCTIVTASALTEIEEVRGLFREYATMISVDLGYQGFEQELARLPGAYASPRGCLLLARIQGLPAGCVALRELKEGVCEMKRLFIRSPYRALGLGRTLTRAIVSHATENGFRTMLLDTLPTMDAALGLYESVGFKRRSPYFDSPVPGNIFMELSLVPNQEAEADV